MTGDPQFGYQLVNYHYFVRDISVTGSNRDWIIQSITYNTSK